MAIDLLRQPPRGFADLAALEPSMRFDIRYHGGDNFTGARLPGYGAPGAWMLEEAAQRVAAVHRELESSGYGLLVYDAYRPRRATRAMVEWAERSGNIHLVESGYIARDSLHARGTTLDVTLFTLDTGELAEMGTEWDVFHEGSHTENATGQARENRRTLAAPFLASDFRGYSKEWWHFTMNTSVDHPARDVPYGASEPGEAES